jgi:NADPH-dependent 2,4-dienoyl-CoA reductase/sulfur reductase-like enzyme
MTTSDPDVFAIGDCSQFPCAWLGAAARLESVQNATDQGKAVGTTVAGAPEPYVSVPRFWSDQYDAKLQIVGLSTPQDDTVVRGDIDQGKFSLFHFRQGRLAAVDSVNRPGDQMVARRLIAAALSPSPAQAADPSFDLRKLEAAP